MVLHAPGRTALPAPGRTPPRRRWKSAHPQSSLLGFAGRSRTGGRWARRGRTSTSDRTRL